MLVWILAGVITNILMLVAFRYWDRTVGVWAMIGAAVALGVALRATINSHQPLGFVIVFVVTLLVLNSLIARGLNKS